MSCGSGARRAERLLTVVSGWSVHPVRLLREGIAGRAHDSTSRREQGEGKHGPVLTNEKTHHHHRPAGSSQGGERVGREVRPRPGYRKRELCQGRDAGLSGRRRRGAGLIASTRPGPSSTRLPARVAMAGVPPGSGLRKRSRSSRQSSIRRNGCRWLLDATRELLSRRS